MNSNPSCSCKPPSRLLWYKLVNNQAKLWTPSPKLRIYSSYFVGGKPITENPNPTLNLGYPHFPKRVQDILGKKRKTRTCIDALRSLEKFILSQNKDIPGTAAKMKLK